jgi:hypothetical protein
MRILIPAWILFAALPQNSTPDGSKQQKPPTEKQDVSKNPPPTPQVPSIDNQKAARSTSGEIQQTPEKSVWGDVPAWLLVAVGGMPRGLLFVFLTTSKNKLKMPELLRVPLKPAPMPSYEANVLGS